MNKYAISVRHLIIMFLCAAALMLPAFFLGLAGGDLQGESLWIKHFSLQFWSGDLYPRWLQGMFAGRGSPMFFFYPPLMYFFTAFFTFLAPLDEFGFYQMAVSCMFAVFVSGITFYIWMIAEGRSKDAALFGSLIYIAAPNHVADNFYYLLMLSSLWVYIWIPLLLMFAKKMARGEPYAVVGYAVSLGLVILTNVPQTLICGGLSVAYYALHLRKESLLPQLARLAVAIAFGFGLSAIYLLPALCYMNYANVDLHWLWPKEDYSNNFYFGFDNTIHGLYTSDLLIVLALLVLYRKAVPKNDFLPIAGITLAAVFMMVPISHLIWAAFPILKILQFPMRLLSITSVTLALLAALAFPRLKDLVYLQLIVYMAAGAFVGVHFKPIADFRTKLPQYTAFKNDIDQRPMYLPSPDVIIKYYHPEAVLDTLRHGERIEVLKGDAKVDILYWYPRDIALLYHADSPSTFRVRQFVFPGYTAFLDGKELDIRRDDHTGEILVDVPKGEGEIHVELVRMVPEVAGKAISILSAAILALWLLIEIRRRKQNLQTV